jgi:hypothetical protein
MSSATARLKRVGHTAARPYTEINSSIARP